MAWRKRVVSVAPVAVPLLAILAARLGTYSDWAVANATLAAVLFAWIAADSLALGAIAKAADKKPGLRKIIGAIALGLAVAIAAASSPVRSALLTLEPLVAAAIGTTAIYLVWSGWLAAIRYSQTRSMELALAEVVPARLASTLLSELAMLRIGLLSWNAPVKVPPDATAHGYHRYLTPMLATFVGLQVIELAVVHLLVSLWNETVALVLLAVSVWGLVWLVALMKSFRLFPVLLTSHSLRVRSGTIVDVDIPFPRISHVDAQIDGERLKAKTTLNLAVMSSPNVCVRLSESVTYSTFLGGEKSIDMIALRLDEPAIFVAELQEKLT